MPTRDDYGSYLFLRDVVSVPSGRRAINLASIPNRIKSPSPRIAAVHSHGRHDTTTLEIVVSPEGRCGSPAAVDRQLRSSRPGDRGDSYWNWCWPRRRPMPRIKLSKLFVARRSTSPSATRCWRRAASARPGAGRCWRHHAWSTAARWRAGNRDRSGALSGPGRKSAPAAVMDASAVGTVGTVLDPRVRASISDLVTAAATARSPFGPASPPRAKPCSICYDKHHENNSFRSAPPRLPWTQASVRCVHLGIDSPTRVFSAPRRALLCAARMRPPSAAEFASAVRPQDVGAANSGDIPIVLLRSTRLRYCRCRQLPSGARNTGNEASRWIW